jgi:acetone carboxylase gamma subunit
MNIPCPNCNTDIRVIHSHQLAHGIPDTHMVDSEEFWCPSCLHLLTAQEVQEQNLVYVYDIHRNLPQ